MAYLGEIFALLTALCWVVGAVFFEYAGKRVGSLVVNLLRLWLAVLLLGLLCLASRGAFWPSDATGHVWRWMAISGALGFFLCDMCLFRAFVLAGARRAMLMLSLSPCFSAVLDLVRQEPFTGQMALGMVITLAGVMFVISRRAVKEESPHTIRDVRLGVILATLAALLQALGATTGKEGLRLPDGTQYNELAATFIRALAGASCFLVLILASGRVATVRKGLGDSRALLALSIGAVVGPVLGVTLFMASLARVPTSVTQTILATMPVLMLPIAHFVSGERITRGSAIGTMVAVIGVIVLSWKP